MFLDMYKRNGVKRKESRRCRCEIINHARKTHIIVSFVG